MKKTIKYLLLGCSLFLLLKNNPKAKNQLEIMEDPNHLTYMIEKGTHKFQLYFHPIRDTETKEILYCLEPGVALSNDVYEELNEWEYQKLNISETTKNFITKVAYYGYLFENHQDFNYYYASQMLIWEKLIPENWQIYFTQTLGGEKITPYEKEKQEILSLIAQDELLPSFANQNFEWNQKEELELWDENHVLQDYVLNENNQVETQKSLDKIEIKSLSSQETTLEFQKNYSGAPLKFYYRQDGQKALKKGALLSKKFKIFLKPYQTTIELTKVDEENKPIANVEFALYQKMKEEYNLITQSITDKKGKIFWTNIPDGEYCVVEKKTPLAYEKKEEKHCFGLNKNGKQIALTIQNEHKKIKLIIQKEEEKTEERLANVRFQLWKGNQLIKDARTDELGQIIINDLIAGEYRLIEIETKEGYVLEQTPKIIILDGSTKEIVIQIKNRKLTHVPNTFESYQKSSFNEIYIERKKRK